MGLSTQQALLSLVRSPGVKGRQNPHKALAVCSLLCTSGELCKVLLALILQVGEQGQEGVLCC